jgi:hypothetical protein
MGNTIRVVLLLSTAWSTFASAANLVSNPDFTAGLMDWSLASESGEMTLDPLDFPGAPALRVTGDTAISGAEVQSTCIPINSTTAFDFRFNAYAVAGQASARMETYADADCLTMLGAIGTQPDGPANDFVVHSLTNVALHTGARSARIVLAATPSPSGGRGDVLFDHIGFGPAGTLAAGININQDALSGAWFNPLFGGQGLQFAISRDLATPGAGSLFGAWYTFDATAGGTDTQRWYSLEAFVGGDATSADVTIYQNIGGNFDAPPTTSAIAVGSGTLEFPSCVSATFDYVFDDGRTGTLSLQRLLANVECAETGTPATPPSDFGLSGAWYDPALGGQGFLIDVNPVNEQVFVGWYTYAVDGAADGLPAQRWFSAQGAYRVGSPSMDLQVYVSTGGTFDSGGTVSTEWIGTATLTFTDCNSADFDFEFEEGELAGESGVIHLQRLGAVPASCDFPE